MLFHQETTWEIVDLDRLPGLPGYAATTARWEELTGFQATDPWSTAFYGNLVHNFCEEIVSGGRANQGNFAQSARVQEIINAVTHSHRTRRWVDLPLSGSHSLGQTSPF